MPKSRKCFFLALASLLALSACASGTPRPETGYSALTVYKHPLCFCCKKWMAHLDENGYSAQTDNTLNPSAVKQQFDIPPAMQSCHTGVVDQKYVFEGHVPAKYIRQYLQNPPANSVGLAVPGMPIGSPGMENGESFAPYNVYLLLKGGDYRLFARVESPSDAQMPVAAQTDVDKTKIQ